MADGRDRVVVSAPMSPMWQTNCYVVADRARGEAAVIDPGQDAAGWVRATLDELGVRCTAILLTHGHLDHLWSAPELAAELDVEVFLHPDDRWLWDRPAAAFGVADAALEQQLGLRWQPDSERLVDLADGTVLERAGMRFRVDHNPGHTPGHVTFLASGLAEADVAVRAGAPATLSDDVLFSGDLVFAGSIGRTDFPRGDLHAMMRSLVATVLPLEDDVVVLSGHGPATTVGRERATNPYLAEAIQRAAS